MKVNGLVEANRMLDTYKGNIEMKTHFALLYFDQNNVLADALFYDSSLDLYAIHTAENNYIFPYMYLIGSTSNQINVYGYTSSITFLKPNPINMGTFRCMQLRYKDICALYENGYGIENNACYICSLDSHYIPCRQNYYPSISDSRLYSCPVCTNYL
jgi:hypothetical protein